MSKLLLPILTCSILLTTACSEYKQKDPRSIVGIDQQVASYVEMFESFYGKKIGDISIGFAPIDGSIIGRCTIWSNGFRQITLDPEYWAQSSERSRIGLVFHELGHCKLNRDHNNDTFYYSGTSISGRVPSSLMNQYNFFSDFYAELENFYTQELFNPNLKFENLKTNSKCVTLIEVNETAN
jgi:hypothetical protein